VTGAEFSGVDIDLLADYVGGALDGTPDEAVVGALIASDAEWRSAYAELSQGMSAVSAGLAAMGAVAEPMPADVIARLEAAFTAEGAPAAPGRRLSAVPSDSDLVAPERTRVTAAGRRRRLRWAMPVAAAAGVIAVAAISADYLFGSTASDNSAASTAAGAPGGGRADQDAPLLADSGGVRADSAAPPMITSGLDYLPGTLALAGPNVAFAATAGGKSPAPLPAKAPEESTFSYSGVPTDLRRLASPAPLQGCLAAIAAENAAGPATWLSVDYARYQGGPALVVRFTAANGKWVWATGPRCGTPGAGAQRLAAVTVG
jgi:hypothetical protein